MECDSRWIGQVVGPKGATIQSLQEESGANIDVDDDGDHKKITIHGTAKAHKIAIAKITAIIKQAENPDYEGEEGKRLRAEAQTCYDERSRCFDEKQAAFDAGEKDKGHALQKEANEWGEKAKATTQEAAVAILAFNNDGKGDMFIDFHGLKVDEAVGFLKARLAAVGASADGERIMEVMPVRLTPAIPTTA